MPMAAQQARVAEPLHDALAAPCPKSQEVAHGPMEPLACKVEEQAMPQRRQGCGIFTPQLWKAVGLVPRQLDALPEQCTPRGTDARAPLLPPSAGGASLNPYTGSGARRLLSGRTFSSDLSFGSASTAGCVSLRMASSDINPKSLKSAAIMAYEASAAEGSDASGALSDSTGVSPGQLPAGSGGGVTSGRPFFSSVSGRQRSVGGHSISGSSLSREAGVAGLPSAAAAGLDVLALADAAHLQHTPSGVSFGSSFGSALLDAGGHPAAAALMGAPSLAARSDTGSADPANVYMGELHECLLCRQHTCFPTGPATIRCSDCRGTMHRDCFIAHYQVVPGRRDWTYCPVHSQVQKNRLPAKPRPSGNAHRRGPQHPRKRPHPEDARGGDGAGDREFTAGPGFERVPSGSRSQRRRGNASGGSAALAAAGMGAAEGDASIAAGSEARSAAASPGSLHGSDGGDAADGDAPGVEAAATAGGPPQRCFVSSRGRESRPVRRQYDSDDAAGDAATPRAGKHGALDPPPLVTGGVGGTADNSPVELDAPGGPPGSMPSSPLGVKSESGSAAEPDSPVAGAAPRLMSGKLRVGGLDADSRAGPAAAAASRLRAADGGGGSRAQGGSGDPASPRGARPQPTSPRSSGGASRKPSRSADGGRGREQRPAPASPRAGGRPRAPPAAAAPAADAAAKSPPPPAAKTPAELNDEELAMLLHQELNAPSRRRGQRMPGAV